MATTGQATAPLEGRAELFIAATGAPRRPTARRVMGRRSTADVGIGPHDLAVCRALGAPQRRQQPDERQPAAVSELGSGATIAGRRGSSSKTSTRRKPVPVAQAQYGVGTAVGDGIRDELTDDQACLVRDTRPHRPPTDDARRKAARGASAAVLLDIYSQLEGVIQLVTAHRPAAPSHNPQPTSARCAPRP